MGLSVRGLHILIGLAYQSDTTLQITSADLYPG